MMYDIFQLVALLANVAAMGYYRYLPGKAKGVLKAVETVLAQREEEDKEKNKTGSGQRPEKSLWADKHCLAVSQPEQPSVYSCLADYPLLVLCIGAIRTTLRPAL